MGYYIDLDKITIDEYKTILKGTNFLPSWEILKTNIDENLDIIKYQNIHNLDELKKSLRTKARLEAFAHQSKLSVEYLTILRRVINGYHPKPNNINDFPNIKKSTVDKLAIIGIKNTMQLYNKITTPENRKTLSVETGISEQEISTLTKLTDLSRVKWANHTFAYVLLLAGYCSAKQIANAHPEQLYEKVKKLNEERKLFPAHIGVNDMRRLIDSAQTLSSDIVI